ncbi:MAG: HAD family hydrolase [Gemmataceae bacterium]
MTKPDWEGAVMFEARGLIFDCDGTLADTMPAHFRAWTAVTSRYGLTFPEQRFYELGGVPSHRIAALLAHEQGKTIDPDRLAREKEEAFLEHLPAIQPVAAVVALAKSAAGRLPMAVASGGFRPVITQVLRQLGILEIFQAIVTAEDTVRHKPEPDVFLEAAKRLGVEPKWCAVYEDTDIGLEAARRAGMAAIDVRPMYGQNGASRRP